MSNKRSIAYDATFMTLYIGLSAAMVTLSVVLLDQLAMDVEFGAPHVAASAFNVLGWSILPFAPRLDKSLIGQTFSWRSNGVLGGEVA
jgi:hypothetical protein